VCDEIQAALLTVSGSTAQSPGTCEEHYSDGAALGLVRHCTRCIRITVPTIGHHILLQGRASEAAQGLVQALQAGKADAVAQSVVQAARSDSAASGAVLAQSAVQAQQQGQVTNGGGAAPAH
jgi:hypothetical protein